MTTSASGACSASRQRLCSALLSLQRRLHPSPLPRHAASQQKDPGRSSPPLLRLPTSSQTREPFFQCPHRRLSSPPPLPRQPSLPCRPHHFPPTAPVLPSQCPPSLHLLPHCPQSFTSCPPAPQYCLPTDPQCPPALPPIPPLPPTGPSTALLPSPLPHHCSPVPQNFTSFPLRAPVPTTVLPIIASPAPVPPELHLLTPSAPVLPPH